MAVVKFIPSRKPQSGGGLHGSIDYCKRKDKTWDERTRRHLVTCVNCLSNTAFQEFMNTKRLYGKTEGRMYYHVIQSFSPEEVVSAETAHEIALKLAQEFTGFEVLVCTHTDRDHLHSHLIVNSVSAENGRKYHSDKDNIQRIRQASDALCLQYGLSVIKPKNKRTPGMSVAEYRSADKGKSWKLRLAIAIDEAMAALFIDYLRQCGVAVLSVTENLNTLSDEDDLIIGVRGLMNDYYAKDIGNKIRHGYRQKQKAGLVITPPFGYWKDRNTNRIHQHPEAAETVRLIYDLYLQGVGQKEIARRLNRLGLRTPAQLRSERYGEQVYAARKDKTGQFVWSYVSVKNILAEESYTGVLINHKTETRSGKATPVAAEQRERHEDFYPAIVTKEEWQKTQLLLKQKARPAFENRAAHRYSGLLICGDCGQPFVPMIRYWNGSRRVEYVCKGYHNHGKGFCASHRIREENLDTQVAQYAQALRDSWQAEQAELQRLYRQWSLRQPALDREIARLKEEIRQHEEDIDELLVLRIQSTK